MVKMNTIDYVVPMVFADDKHWLRELRQAGSDAVGSNAARYRSWDTEELLIRCIRKFMPWVRNIYIVLASESQVQPWMEEYLTGDIKSSRDNNITPNVKIVYHRDFMPRQALPTFNSRAIEMFLHKIPGISERFLYGNADMFPIAPLYEHHFFAGNLPCIHMKEKEFPNPPNNFQMACMAGLNFVAEEFGLRFTDTWYKNGHSIAPILKSTCEHLWQRGGERIMASVSPFRESRNFNQYIYSWWQYLSGQYVDYTPERQLIMTYKVDAQDAARIILDPQVKMVCINDHEKIHDITYYASVVRDALEKKLEK